jgi:prephenate dehydrogenase
MEPAFYAKIWLSEVRTMSIASVKIIGSGLIGTSIGLALAKKDVNVLMVDSSADAASLAQSLVDPVSKLDEHHDFDVVVIAVPPSSFKAVIEVEKGLNPTSTFVDILSIKTKPQLEVEAYSDLAQRFVGTHPMAGREVSGAKSARGDLFTGRSWIICPSEQTTGSSEKIVRELIEICGGVVVKMSASEHDQAMALVSHAPQVLASLMAGALTSAKPEWLNLIGQGFRDMTRIADSDSKLWQEILSENAENISGVLSDVRKKIEEIENDLNNPTSAKKVIDIGNEGRSLIPGKHGGVARKYIYLHIVIDDKAGQLAAIFNDCAKAQINIEDVSIEHTPGQNTGLVTLSVLEAQKAEQLQQFLITTGWKVHSTSK